MLLVALALVALVLLVLLMGAEWGRVQLSTQPPVDLTTTAHSEPQRRVSKG